MKQFLCIAICLSFFGAAVLHAGEIHHEIKVDLDPKTHRIAVEDTIRFPKDTPPGRNRVLHFLLHRGLEPQSPNPGTHITPLDDEAAATAFEQLPEAFSPTPDTGLEAYRLSLPAGQDTAVLRYAGKIDHPLHQEGEDHARSFQQTPGTVSEEGIYLEGATYWLPWFDQGLLTFTLDVTLPAGWDAVSQGERTRHEKGAERTEVRWESPEPQDAVFLIGGQFTEYSRPAGKVLAQAFLRTPDPALAEKYLGVTGQYIEMYDRLLGPYPYGKFALVENFWDTGYGMPSFTLLGPQIIRFPFILHSSYPHEILHNWWGNGVFVDAASGNWSEGLTAYLADHLIQEQRGRGRNHRRAVLQKYADYVSAASDIPLTAFRERHNPVTEAVGYGKTLMFFHMLRYELSDELFVRSLQDVYRSHRFKRASFEDLESAFSKRAQRDLSQTFAQWVRRTGAPQLRVEAAQAVAIEGGYRLTATLKQIQSGPAYRLNVPIAVHLEGQAAAHQTALAMTEKELQVELMLPARPLRLDVDPEFDLFRRLDRNEIPPALSLAFGGKRPLMLLPAKEKDSATTGYRQLAESWRQSQNPEIEIAWDEAFETLPSDRTVWLLGWENQFLNKMSEGLRHYDTALGAGQVRIGQDILRREEQATVVVTRNGENPNFALAWLAGDNPAALPGLARKLPHYGRYSYLGFKGDEPENKLKGEWPIIQSPMSVRVAQTDGKRVKVVTGKLAARQALATLPSVFSEERMHADLRFLADEKMKGRGFGTPELDRAADYIAEQFRKAGLIPLGDAEGSYFQSFEARAGDPEKTAVLKNVVGLLPGNNADWAGQSVVVGAHYDHLGLGWPDAHRGDDGKIHPGADDNASGVAVLLELARSLAGQSPQRSVIFVAFSGEEVQALGSRHYVQNQKDYPAEKMMGMLNMDTVGRLGNKKLRVFGAETAKQWPHLFRGIGFVTGISIQTVENEFNPSDQLSFHAAGVPAVQVFSGGHDDFHRPSDTLDKIDTAGMAKVAKVMSEAIAYLAERPDPMTVTLSEKNRNPAQQSTTPRRVGLGTLPDFAYEGKGARIDGVSSDSPAEKAGLRAGDIILLAS